MEDSIQLASYYTLSGLMDYSAEGEKSSLGFMELLNMQDFGPSFLDMLQLPPEPLIQTQTQTQTPTVFQESSEGMNIPNDSSVSSESCGGPNDEQNKEVVDGEEGEDLETHNKKRQRELRFAFMTKSKVDRLEDGYRWRKYGLKAVKNSPFPRSYYWCTSASCNVKKRVERCYHNPSTVVTTNEGQPTHPTPVMARPNPADALASGSAFFSGGAPPAQTVLTPLSY